MDLFDYMRENTLEKEAPLASRMRPETLDEVVGQQHLVAKGAVLRRIVESGEIPNMIFYGPSGVGKTTVARIIAQSAGKKLYKLNGTTASTADIKDIVAQTGTLEGLNGILLYLDEIQYLNKKQQQTLLEFIENGSITLISSTTENPYFYVYNAILSRSTVFEFKPVTPQDVENAIRRAFSFLPEAFLPCCEKFRLSLTYSKPPEYFVSLHLFIKQSLCQVVFCTFSVVFIDLEPPFVI